MIFLCLADAKLVYIRGGHEVRTNIHACQCNIEMSVYIVRPASRAKTLSLSVSNKPKGWNKQGLTQWFLSILSNPL